MKKLMRGSLAERVRDTGEIPLGWAGSTMGMDYLNFGDALSPMMVALYSGKPIRRVPFASQSLRMAAVGTIAHGFEGGEVWFWGTGCSSWRNPSAAADQRVRFAPPPGSRFEVNATRGPVSEHLLNGGPGTGIYGDPVWLLPRSYNPPIAKKWKLGCILHLSELADRTYEAHPHPHLERYKIPADFADQVHLITTVTPIGIGHVRSKIDEILACERIVSTSLHGMVIAESYGIPCLYFGPAGANDGVADLDLSPEGRTDLRIVDLYRGLGCTTRKGFVQPRATATDWAALMRAIDSAWTPVELDGDALVDAFPIDVDLIDAPPGQTIWDHPAMTGIALQHDVGALRKADKTAAVGPSGAKPE